MNTEVYRRESRRGLMLGTVEDQGESYVLRAFYLRCGVDGESRWEEDRYLYGQPVFKKGDIETAKACADFFAKAGRVVSVDERLRRMVAFKERLRDKED